MSRTGDWKEGQRVPRSAWKRRQQRGDPLTRAETERLTRRQEEPAPAPAGSLIDTLGLTLPLTGSALDGRRTQVLRFLGRVGASDASTLHQIFYAPQFDLRTTYHDLARLREAGLTWSAQGPSGGRRKVNNGSTGRPRTVVGLSLAGRELLRSHGVEPDATHVEYFRAHHPRRPPTSHGSLAHDLQAAWWCASMIQGLRLIPWCQSIYCQAGVAITPNHRPSAILTARFNFERQRSSLASIPWFDGSALKMDEVEVRWALEVDTGARSMGDRIDMFVRHRDLHADGVYQKRLGGEVMPVILTQTPRRAQALAMECSDAWPEGWAVISTPDTQGARARSFGAVWGRYFSANSQKEVELLSVLTRDPETRRRKLASLMTHDLWLRWLELDRAGVAPTSWYDMEAYV